MVLLIKDQIFLIISYQTTSNKEIGVVVIITLVETIGEGDFRFLEEPGIGPLIGKYLFFSAS